MLYSIQTLRAIAAWIVVAHHYVQAHGFSQKTPYLAFLSNYGAIGVDIFFIISGFVVYNSAQKNTVSPLNFAIHRAARIIPIYWLCTFITALLFIFWPKFIPSIEVDSSFFIRSLLFIPSPHPSGFGIYPLVTVGWTLNFEVIFYLILFFALFFGKNRLIFTVFIGIFILNSILAKHIPAFQHYASSIIYEFCMGILIAAFYEKNEYKNVNLITSIILLSIGIYLLYRAGGVSHDPIKNGIPCSLIFISAISQERYFSNFKYFNHLGNWSYSTYLFHSLIILICIKFTNKFSFNEKITIILIIAFTLAVSYLSFRYIEKPISENIKAKFRH